MDPVNLRQFLTNWNGDFVVTKEDGTQELASKAALQAIDSISVPDARRALLRISGSDPLLTRKIGRLLSLFQTVHSLSRSDLEDILHLREWNGGAQTEIAKSRIISCYLNQSTTLDLSNLDLSSLPDSLNTLTIRCLNCSKNQLRTLSPLPASLKILICSHNQLNSLPPLPSSLTNIDCEDNLITALPDLPNSLNILICINNLITALPYIPATTIATFSLREDAPFKALLQNLKQLAGTDLPPYLQSVDLTAFDEAFTEAFLNWYDLLTHQKDFEGEVGKKNLALTLLGTLSLSASDPDYLDVVKAALSEALDTCTDRSLYYLNFLTVARKLKESTSEVQKIGVLKGAFAFSQLEKAAKAIIESRLNTKAFSLGRPLTDYEIEEIKHEEIELYLALQIKLKDHFGFPIETSSMRFDGLDRLSAEEIGFAKTFIISQLENEEAFLDFSGSEESWKESMKKIHSAEFAELEKPFREELERLLELQEELEKPPEESVYASLLDCRASIGSVMQEMKKAELLFTKMKTKELLEILDDLSTWKPGSKSEEAKRRILDCYMTKSPSLDLSLLCLKSLPNCLAHLSHLTHLNCSHNLLTSLPLLPHLQAINCSFNRLHSLPPFPPHVKINASINPYL